MPNIRKKLIELLDTDTGIPEEKCIGCILQWLRQPAEEGGCDG